MTDKEFYDWFVERAEKFADIGIMHPNSDWGKLVRISLLANDDKINALEKRINELEEQLSKKKSKKV